MRELSNNEPHELSEMIEDKRHQLWCAYYDKFVSAFAELEKPGWFGDIPSGWFGDIPLPILGGIAQAFAEVSGCRVVLHAFILEPIKESPGTMREVGTRELLSAEP